MKTESPIRSVMLINKKEEATELYNQLLKTDRLFNMTITDQYDQFVKSVATEVIECFIFDWNYDHFSIVELVARLRSIDQYKNTPIICITDIDEKEKPMQLSSFINLVITRPFNFQDFNKSFGELMDNGKLLIPSETSILIMDDNPDILEIMVDYMKEIKHTNYKTCESISQAKVLVNKFDFDLFLLDWNLDDGTCMDIINFVRTKKQNKRLSEALIMVVTSRSDIDDTMTLIRNNVKDHLIKPFEYPEFKEKITYALERHTKNLKTA